jgi:hypothetical protein
METVEIKRNLGIRRDTSLTDKIRVWLADVGKKGQTAEKAIEKVDSVLGASGPRNGNSSLAT